MFFSNPQIHWTNTYPFSNRFSINPTNTALLSSIPGIYAFLYQNEVMYIGQSNSIGTRVTSHEVIQKIKTAMKCDISQIFISYCYENSKYRRNQIEQDLIRKLNPRFNTQYNIYNALNYFLK